MKFRFIIVILFLIGVISCSEEDSDSNSNPGNNNGISSGNWLIPEDEIFDGGPGKDGIPSLENPEMISAVDAAYLDDQDLVIGFKDGDEVKAYSHKVLDWHEIINDKVGDINLAVTYCPLTGTGIGWSRNVDGRLTTFGVSGLLYNANLIPFDRLTDSNWSQILLESVNGELIDTDVKTYQVIETTWKTWKELYPDTKVVSTNTGFNRNYQRYPYGDYRTNHGNILFPFEPMDDRLPNKERVHGIIIGGDAKVYRFNSFVSGTEIIQDSFKDNTVIVVGNQEKNFIVSFFNPDQINFSLLDEESDFMFQDEAGNKYNLFGEVVKGPDQGDRLKPTESFIGYWFSWGAFYPQPIIYENN